MMQWITNRTHAERLALACTAICTAAVWRLIPSLDHPVGSDWAQYFTVAEIIWHQDPHLYPPFRKPLFGLILGGLGEPMGYLDAAQLLGRASACLIVISAALGAWALVGPLAAAGAAVIAALMPLVVDGGLWVNNYPLLSASSSVAIAAGAALARRPHPAWAALCGVAAGLAIGLDVRGLAVVPTVSVLLLISLHATAWRRRLLIIGLMGAPVVSLLAYDAWLIQTHNIPQFSLESQSQRQRQTVLEPIARGQYVSQPELAAACTNLTPAPPWQQALDLRQGSCASALRAYSTAPLRELRVVPGVLTLCVFILALVPMGWRSRAGPLKSVLASAAVLGLPGLWTVAGMGWIFYFDRYLMPFSAVLAMGIPVALGRVATLLPHPSARWLALATSLTWGATIWPGHDAHGLHTPQESVPADRAAGVMAQWAKTHLGAKDRVFDCGGLAFDYLLLPKQIAYVRHPPGDTSCDPLIRSPGRTDGRSYLVTPVLPGQTGLSTDPRRIQALGWTPIHAPTGLDNYRIWTQ